MLRKACLVALVLGSASLAAGSAWAQFPSLTGSQNPLGPEYIITFKSDGSIATGVNPAYSTNPGPYDGSEDTYFGVINNSKSSISSFNLSSSLTLFGFDGDGIDTFGVTKNASNPDTTGYGGPNAFFTNINGATTAGTVNFFAPIAANGGTDVFSLEEPVALNSLVINGGVPEPSTWAMMILGFAGIGYLSYRRSRKTLAAA